MSRRTVGFLTISLSIVAATPVLARHALDLSLGSEWSVTNFRSSPNSNSSSDTFEQTRPTPPDGVDLSLDAQTRDGTPAKVSVGSVGFREDGSYRAAGNDSYFDIPSQRLPTSAPSLLVRVPLENNPP
jgi:hypothetical protein